MLSLSLGVLLAASAVPSLAIPGFTCVGVDGALCTAYEDRLASQLGAGGQLTVVTHGDIEKTLGFERQKQLLGCASEEGSCLSELAGALGVDGLVTASIARSGSSIIMSVRVVRARDGSTWASLTERVRDEDGLLDALDRAAQQLRAQLAPASATSPSLVPPLLLGVGGALVAGGGAIAFVASKDDARALKQDVFADADAVTARQSAGQTKEAVGVALLGVGGAAIAGAVVWGLLLPRQSPTLSVAPLPGGAVVQLGGTLSW